MTPLYKVEVRVYDPEYANSIRKIFFIREDLSEAAILGWQKILEEKGGSMCWVKADGKRALLGTFLPIGHPTHTYLVSQDRISATQHFWQLLVKVVNLPERVLFTTCVQPKPEDKDIFFPGTFYHGLN